MYAWLVAICQVVSVVGTWPLWQARADPPLLPLLPLPPLDFGPPLIVAALASALVGTPAALVNALLVAAAMAADQTRMQPWAMSFPLLLLGAGARPGWLLVGRCHLIALWFWAGISKPIAGVFAATTAAAVVGAWWPEAPAWFVIAAGTGVAAAEIALALAAAVPRVRLLAGWGALVLHAGILVALLPRADHRNPAVWPWNIALAVSGLALIAPWRDALPRSLAAAPAAARVAAGTLLLLPAGFYLGVVDAYPAHHLYAGDVAAAVAVCPAGCDAGQDPNSTWETLGVPLPPEPRLFEAFFLTRCQRGDALRIVDPRPGPWGAGQRTVFCPARAPAPAYP